MGWWHWIVFDGLKKRIQIKQNYHSVDSVQVSTYHSTNRGLALPKSIVSCMSGWLMVDMWLSISWWWSPLTSGPFFHHPPVWTEHRAVGQIRKRSSDWYTWCVEAKTLAFKSVCRLQFIQSDSTTSMGYDANLLKTSWKTLFFHVQPCNWDDPQWGECFFSEGSWNHQDVIWFLFVSGYGLGFIPD